MKRVMNSGECWYKNNVMTPLNWFTGLTEFALLPTAAYTWDKELIGPICLLFAILIILFWATIYVIWMFKDPNRLQSEGYNLMAQGIEVGSSLEESNTGVINIENNAISSATDNKILP